jgi:hypothetical protein
MTRLLIIVVLTFTLPTLAHASDYETESRLLDLEQRTLDLKWQALAAEQRAIDAEMQTATRERKAEIAACFAKELVNQKTFLKDILSNT